MRILWLNPSFLDYRIPVYKKINKLADNNFYLIFSKHRCKSHIPLKTKIALGENAICFKYDKVLNIGLNHTMANKHIDIPITIGLFNEIKKIKPDIIIAEGFFQWTPIALRYCIAHKKPLLIAYERTKWTERSCPYWRTLYRKIIDHYTKGYLVNGTLTKEYLEDTIQVNPSKIYIGGMSADSQGLSESISQFDYHSDKNLRNIRYNCKGILYIYSGQMIERKGIKYLLKAWEIHAIKYPQDCLLLVGGGELLNEFKQDYINYCNIIFTDTIPYDSIYKYYAIADVFIIPTLEDNWSLVVPEAMACGLPIACSIYNGCHPELVHEGENGVTFDPLKPDSILQALEIFHHVDLKNMEKKSIQIESQYNSDVVAQNIYNACCKIFKL